MALTPHPSLDGYYTSSHGNWAFSIDPGEDGDGDIESVDEAIAAWVEWREFLVKRQADESSAPLF